MWRVKGVPTRDRNVNGHDMMKFSDA